MNGVPVPTLRLTPGSARPPDVPSAPKEPQARREPLEGAAAHWPGHAPPRVSGGPGDIPVGWLRVCRRRWNRVGS